MSLRSLGAAFISLIFLLIAFWCFQPRTSSPALAYIDPSSRVLRISSATFSSSAYKPQIEKTEFLSSPAAPSFEEILKKDDVCALTNLRHSLINEQNTAPDLLKAFFETSQFRSSYFDVQAALNGEQPLGDYASVLYYLNKANLLEGGKILQKSANDFEEAFLGFQRLEENDSGNAALIVFQLAMISSEQDPDFASLMGRLKDADHFDTYMLGYVKDMSLADAPSAIGLLMKIQHFATLPMPSWMKIRDHLKVLLKNEPEALEHIGWLMAQGGLKAKAHAFSLSYNILEYSFGRTLIKSQKIPNYKDLNNSFAPPPADIDDKLADVEDHCTDQSADKLRQYSNTLRQEGWGLGIM